MRARGQLLDNACAESFLHSSTVAAIHEACFATRERMCHTVFAYIEVDDNRSHRHSANAYISPMAFGALKHA